MSSELKEVNRLLSKVINSSYGFDLGEIYNYYFLKWLEKMLFSS